MCWCQQKIRLSNDDAVKLAVGTATLPTTMPLGIVKKRPTM
jgi:hypothetical protein